MLPPWIKVKGPLRPSFFFNDTATTEIYTLPLHDALPILVLRSSRRPAPLQFTVPALFSVRPVSINLSLAPLMFITADEAIDVVPTPLMNPPVQFIVPERLRFPVPPNVPPDRFTVLAVTGV